ncbi:F-box domain-containing protein [Mycena venus]|uniref:F-box domain-containing protein n=1 Tax=Mycena venus TaxID=2733690 RepID=A0A8H6WU29_9AGAR|nr:F-box domain-containing protein [Mycena venus]
MTLPEISSAPGACAKSAARAADRARIAEIDAQISDLERYIHSLQEERSSLEGRLATYTYPVLTLPDEIVSEIFINFLPVYPKCPQPIGPESPYLLCQICREWRDIAFATPALWRAISLSFGKVHRIPQKLHYLDTLLKRSGLCLLSIQLESRTTDRSELAELGPTIIKHGGRLEYLDLSFQGSFGFLPDGELTLSNLRGLKLGQDVESSTATPLATPSLRKVVLGRYREFFSQYFSVVPINGNICANDPPGSIQLSHK